MGKIYLNDVGTKFEITLKDEGIIVDLSTASLKEIHFKKPNNGPVVIQSANYTTDGTDGKIEYLTVSGDLNKRGVWEIQAKITLGTGTWSSDTSIFEVFQTLEE